MENYRSARALATAWDRSLSQCRSIQEVFVLQLLRSFAVERYIVLSPAGGWRSKCWPPERYGALCQKIHCELGLRCVLNYGPGEDDVISAVKAASGEAGPVAYNGSCDRTSLRIRRTKMAMQRSRRRPDAAGRITLQCSTAIFVRTIHQGLIAVSHCMRRGRLPHCRLTAEITSSSPGP